MPIANAAPATTVADPIQALYHKITWKLIPFLCFCYLAAYLDRINIGFAKLQMLDQLHFSETAFGLGAGLFLSATSCLKCRATWCWKRSARRSGSPGS